MQTIDAKDAAAGFDHVLELVQDGPLNIQENGRDVAVVMSIAQYEALVATQTSERVRPIIKKLFAASVEKHGAVYEALARHEAEHPENLLKR